MRLLNPSLPPLVIILLLVFLWFILLALTLWFALRPRRAPESRTDPQRERRQPRAEKDTPPRPVRVVRAQSVREVPAEKGTNEAQDNAFDDFMKPGNRRDDFDF